MIDPLQLRMEIQRISARGRTVTKNRNTSPGIGMLDHYHDPGSPYGNKLAIAEDKNMLEECL